MLQPKIQRQDLQQLDGINERTIRYLESLASGIDSCATLTGQGSPEGVVNANRSRLYMDLATGALYKNTNAADDQSTGWIIV